MREQTLQEDTEGSYDVLEGALIDRLNKLAVNEEPEGEVALSLEPGVGIIIVEGESYE